MLVTRTSLSSWDSVRAHFRWLASARCSSPHTSLHRSTLFPRFFTSICSFFECSAVLDLADIVKFIVHPSTGRPMPFVCGLCVQAFLPSGAAADEYIWTVAHAPTEAVPRSVAAELGRCRNTRVFQLFPSALYSGLLSREVQAARGARCIRLSARVLLGVGQRAAP